LPPFVACPTSTGPRGCHCSRCTPPLPSLNRVSCWVGQVEFKSFGVPEVDVRGWPQLATEAEQKDWIEKFSDNGLLYFEVQKA
jgi:hypothetical protein